MSTVTQALLFLALVLPSQLCAGQVNLVPEDDNTDTIATDLEGMKILFNETLFGYDTRIRPRINQSHVVHINSSFVPVSLLHFDTSEQKFSVLGYFRIKWNDDIVIWTPSDYADTNTIKVPVSEIWTPSLIILKAFDGNGIVGNADTDIAKISDKGIVQWVPDGIYSVVCHVNIKYYPFDEQTCIITYYVSDETVATVELDHENEVDTSEFTENSAWLVESITRTRYLKYNTYHIDIKFTLQRRANFTTFTLIMPLLMLAFLNICIFLVPIDSGEKGSFAITIFLSYGIFVTIVSDTLPDNSLQVSYFLLFIIFLLFMSVMSVLYTIIQAKVVASIGDNECSIKCCRPRRFKSDKVGMSAGGDDCVKDPDVSSLDLDNDGNDDVYTWKMFLERMDTIIFIVFFILILLFTTAFFSLLLKRVSETSIKQ